MPLISTEDQYSESVTHASPDSPFGSRCCIWHRRNFDGRKSRARPFQLRRDTTNKHKQQRTRQNQSSSQFFHFKQKDSEIGTMSTNEKYNDVSLFKSYLCYNKRVTLILSVSRKVLEITMEQQSSCLIVDNDRGESLRVRAWPILLGFSLRSVRDFA